MNFKVVVRSARGALIEEHRCETPMDGLSWLAAQFQAQKGFDGVAVARCWNVGALNIPMQWEFKVS